MFCIFVREWKPWNVILGSPAILGSVFTGEPPGRSERWILAPIRVFGFEQFFWLPRLNGLFFIHKRSVRSAAFGENVVPRVEGGSKHRQIATTDQQY